MKKFIASILFICILVMSMTFTGFAAYENTHKKTGNQVDDLIAVAQTQLGYREGATANDMSGNTSFRGDGNYTKYGAWYGINPGGWCSMFVSWCANQAGIPTSIIPKHADVNVAMSFYKNNGLWGWGKYWAPKQGKKAYTPKKGDLVFYGNGDLDNAVYIGIVYDIDAETLFTIEGNHLNMCCYVEHKLDEKYIYGYGKPQYTSGAGTISFKTPSFTITNAPAPVSLPQGGGYSIYGKISSANRMTNIKFGIYDSNGKCMSNSMEVKPGTYSYDIVNANPLVKFGVLKPGQYTYIVEAKDETGANEVLIISPFTVNGKVGKTISKKFKVTAGELNMRSGASESSSVYGTVSKGTEITVTQLKDGWARTVYKGNVAYCSAQYLRTVETYSSIGETVTPSPTNKPTATPSPTPTNKPEGIKYDADKYSIPIQSVRQGARGNDVLWVQSILAELGYNISVDGGFGPATKEAVIKYQKANNLSADGSVGPATKNALQKNWESLKILSKPQTNTFYDSAKYKTPATSVRKGTKGNDAYFVQSILKDLGYSIAVDGSFGAGTENTVKEFQKNNGLAVDGSVGPATRSLLLSKWQKKYA